MALLTEILGKASLRIYDDHQLIGEVCDLRLQNVRFRRDGRLLIGEEVPLPLYWEQYAHHEHPERNCGSNASVRVIESGEDRIVMECCGSTGSGSVRSEYIVTLTRTNDPVSYCYEVSASVQVSEGSTWEVTVNPHHGELEFCNFWPDGIFSADGGKPLRYTSCYIVKGSTVSAIAHHHLESSDKHNILLDPGDRVMWLLEDENPCIELVSAHQVNAGVCAYMWDVHMAYRICHEGTTKTLRAGDRFNATYRLSSISKAEGEGIVALATRTVAPEAGNVPVIVDGVHTFGETLADTKQEPSNAWPWETEVLSGDANRIVFALDREVGLDDRASVRIDAAEQARAVWKATAIGPAFRQARFETGSRYRLVAYARIHMQSGGVTIALRIHREGSPGIYDPTSYDVYRSSRQVGGGSEWIRLELVTPVIVPAPDRIHLLLEMEGIGSCWFDNVHFSRGK